MYDYRNGEVTVYNEVPRIEQRSMMQLLVCVSKETRSMFHESKFSIYPRRCAGIHCLICETVGRADRAAVLGAYVTIVLVAFGKA